MNLMNDIKKSIDPSDSDESIRAVFDKYEYRIDFIISYYSLKSYNLGYISQAKLHGVDKVFINFNSDIDKENHDGDVINTSAYLSGNKRATVNGSGRNSYYSVEMNFVFG